MDASLFVELAFVLCEVFACSVVDGCSAEAGSLFVDSDFRPLDAVRAVGGSAGFLVCDFASAGFSICAVCAALLVGVLGFAASCFIAAVEFLELPDFDADGAFACFVDADCSPPDFAFSATDCRPLVAVRG